MPTGADTLARPFAEAASGVARIRFFGRIADVFGRSLEVTIPSQGCALEDLKARISNQTKGGAAALCEPCIRVAIDQVMPCGEAWVKPGQEVAFLSAFSGG